MADLDRVLTSRLELRRPTDDDLGGPDAGEPGAVRLLHADRPVPDDVLALLVRS